MDASEWEAMKKNERLLEEALKREKEQSSIIDKLKEEKIEAMEVNSKKVTIVEEVHTVQTLLCQNDPEEIFNHLEYLFSNRKGSGRHSFGLDSQIYSAIDYIKKLFYTENHEVRNQDGVRNKTVTYKGFDEVKSEIKKEYVALLIDETKSELDDAKKIFKKNAKITQDNKHLKAELKLAESNLSFSEKNVKDLSKKLELSVEKNKECVGLDDLKQSTLEILNSTSGMFGNRDSINKLKYIWFNEFIK